MLPPTKLFIVMALAATVSGSAIPIWELLTQQEKMGRLMYVFIHLVDQYCKDSSIPDCQKVLTLYGMSNLVNEEEKALDIMDPYQRDSRNIIWEAVMKGDFKLPSQKTFYPDEDAGPADGDDYDLVNEVPDRTYALHSTVSKTPNDPHPYAVRVPAPTKLPQPAPTVRPTPPSAASHGAPHVVAGIKPSADFEPMMAEGVRVETRVLPPGVNTRPQPVYTVVRNKRMASPFNEEELGLLASNILKK